MKRLHTSTPMILLLLFTSFAFSPIPEAGAGPDGRQSVRVRLVIAEQRDDSTTDDALADVIPLLQQNLRFNTYRLLHSENTVPRAGTTIELPEDLAVSFLKINGNTFSVRISRGEQPLINTRITLRANRPVVLGGFPQTDESVLLLILGEGRTD